MENWLTYTENTKYNRISKEDKDYAEYVKSLESNNY